MAQNHYSVDSQSRPYFPNNQYMDFNYHNRPGHPMPGHIMPFPNATPHKINLPHDFYQNQYPKAMNTNLS